MTRFTSVRRSLQVRCAVYTLALVTSGIAASAVMAAAGTPIGPMPPPTNPGIKPKAPLAAPTNLRATGVIHIEAAPGDTWLISLAWEDNSSAEDGYLIQFNDGGSGSWFTLESLPPSTTAKSLFINFDYVIGDIEFRVVAYRGTTYKPSSALKVPKQENP